MNLTKQGSEVLSKVYEEFKHSFLDDNPGASANDVERAFLHRVAQAVEFALPNANEVYNKIGDIR